MMMNFFLIALIGISSGFARDYYYDRNSYDYAGYTSRSSNYRDPELDYKLQQLDKGLLRNKEKQELLQELTEKNYHYSLSVQEKKAYNDLKTWYKDHALLTIIKKFQKVLAQKKGRTQSLKEIENILNDALTKVSDETVKDLIRKRQYDFNRIAEKQIPLTQYHIFQWMSAEGKQKFKDGYRKHSDTINIWEDLAKKGSDVSVPFDDFLNYLIGLIDDESCTANWTSCFEQHKKIIKNFSKKLKEINRLEDSIKIEALLKHLDRKVEEDEPVHFLKLFNQDLSPQAKKQMQENKTSKKPKEIPETLEDWKKIESKNPIHYNESEITSYYKAHQAGKSHSEEEHKADSATDKALSKVQDEASKLGDQVLNQLSKSLGDVFKNFGSPVK